MPPGRPVRRWPVAGSPSQGQPGTERRCRCDWRHAARWSRPPPTLNGSCMRWCRRARGAPRPPARLDHPAADRHLWAAAPADRLGRRDHRDRGQPARLGPPCTAAGPRDRRAHWRHHHAGPGLAAGPAAPARRGPDRGRQRAVHLVARWPLPQRRCLRDPGRRPPDPGLQRPDRAGSAQPLRGPPAQPGAAPHRPDQAALRPATRAYAQHRRAQGKTNREIKRSLVRYVARQLYRLLEHPAL
jgi:hypothetical protein